MSFYNMIFGKNSMADLLLAMVGLKPGQIGRFRDAYWNGSEVCVYTRMGGGNRETYEAEIEALLNHPGYVDDEDDDFDSTYATFRFKPLPAFAEAAAQLTAEDATPAQRWDAFLHKMDTVKPGEDPHVDRVVEAMRPTIEAISKALKPKEDERE